VNRVAYLQRLLAAKTASLVHDHSLHFYMKLSLFYLLFTRAAFMLNITPLEPSHELLPVIERFFFTSGTVPDGQTWEHVALPSIMQSFILSFTSTCPKIITDQSTIDISGALIVGQHTKRFRSFMTGKLQFLGVHFTPVGLYRLVHIIPAWWKQQKKQKGKIEIQTTPSSPFLCAFA
jgi:hypothetical protein